MGDVIHAFPVVGELHAHVPGIEIDWVVEEAFAALPPLHPGVARVVPVAVRRWRRRPFAREVRAEIRALRERLREARYERVIDLQGLVKSAWIARMAAAPVAGFDRASVREPLATLAYAHRHRVDPKLHAIERLRRLAGAEFGYEPRGLPEFGLRPVDAPMPDGAVPGDPYAVMLHATSRAEKRWPDDDWIALAEALSARGLATVWPWGSPAEQRVAEALAGRARGRLAPRLDLAQCAVLLSRARLVVGVDTGLTHLSAALERPTIALFAATPAWRFGPYWTPRAVSLGEAGRWPRPAEVVAAADSLLQAGA